MTTNVYTQEVVERLITDYTGVGTPMERDAVVEKYAKELGTSVPSVRGVLVSRKVYVTKAKPSSETGGSMNKAELASAIRIFAQVGAKQLPTLTKMTKEDLEVLLEALRQIALLFEVEKPSIN